MGKRRPAFTGCANGPSSARDTRSTDLRLRHLRLLRIGLSPELKAQPPGELVSMGSRPPSAKTQDHQGARYSHTSIDCAARHRGGRITAGYVGLALSWLNLPCVLKAAIDSGKRTLGNPRQSGAPQGPHQCPPPGSGRPSSPPNTRATMLVALPAATDDRLAAPLRSSPPLEHRSAVRAGGRSPLATTCATGGRIKAQGR
jgi:hypothetical protein